MGASGGDSGDPAGLMPVEKYSTLTGVRTILVNAHGVGSPIDQLVRRLPPKLALGGRVVHKELRKVSSRSVKAGPLIGRERRGDDAGATFEGLRKGKNNTNLPSRLFKFLVRGKTRQNLIFLGFC